MTRLIVEKLGRNCQVQGATEKKKYLPIENVKRVSMYESGNFVRINSSSITTLYGMSSVAFSSYTANKDTSHKRPAKFIIQFLENSGVKTIDDFAL